MLNLTQDKVLAKLSLLYPAVNNETLSLLVDDACEFLLTYCNLEELPQGSTAILTKMVQEDLSKLYSEGITSEQVGGNSASYSTDYTEPIYKGLHKFKKIKTVKSSIQKEGDIDVL